MVDDSKPPKPFVPPAPDEETRLYWDRLDARFANLNAAPPPTAPVAPPAPTPASAPSTPVAVRVENVAPESPAPAAVIPAPVTVTDASRASLGTSLVADAFAALLALEDGQPGARPVRLTIGDQTPSPPEITDAMIEDIVRRVVERLGPDVVRAVVVDVVSHISERLVKEEIERIRNQHV